MSTQDTADANCHYATYRCCQWAQLRCCPSPCDDAVCVNAAVEIIVLDYNVTVGRSTAYGEFVTWYGLHQIRGVFWTLRCLHKPCVKPCFSCIECSSHYIDADHAILGRWAVGVPVCGLYLPILVWPTRLFLSKDLGAIWTRERRFTPQCGEKECESGNGRGSEVNRKGITSTCNWHCGES